jgi:hypothetical protein
MKQTRRKHVRQRLDNNTFTSTCLIYFESSNDTTMRNYHELSNRNVQEPSKYLGDAKNKLGPLCLRKCSINRLPTDMICQWDNSLGVSTNPHRNSTISRLYTTDVPPIIGQTHLGTQTSIEQYPIMLQASSPRLEHSTSKSGPCQPSQDYDL